MELELDQKYGEEMPSPINLNFEHHPKIDNLDIRVRVVEDYFFRLSIDGQTKMDVDYVIKMANTLRAKCQPNYHLTGEALRDDIKKKGELIRRLDTAQDSALMGRLNLIIMLELDD